MVLTEAFQGQKVATRSSPVSRNFKAVNNPIRVNHVDRDTGGLQLSQLCGSGISAVVSSWLTTATVTSVASAVPIVRPFIV
jgi:hypothetical protein